MADNQLNLNNQSMNVDSPSNTKLDPVASPVNTMVDPAESAASQLSNALNINMPAFSRLTDNLQAKQMAKDNAEGEAYRITHPELDTATLEALNKTRSPSFQAGAMSMHGKLTGAAMASKMQADMKTTFNPDTMDYSTWMQNWLKDPANAVPTKNSFFLKEFNPQIAQAIDSVGAGYAKSQADKTIADAHSSYSQLLANKMQADAATGKVTDPEWYKQMAAFGVNTGITADQHKQMLVDNATQMASQGHGEFAQAIATDSNYQFDDEQRKTLFNAVNQGRAVAASHIRDDEMIQNFNRNTQMHDQILGWVNDVANGNADAALAKLQSPDTAKLFTGSEGANEYAKWVTYAKSNVGKQETQTQNNNYAELQVAMLTGKAGEKDIINKMHEQDAAGNYYVSPRQGAAILSELKSRQQQARSLSLQEKSEWRQAQQYNNSLYKSPAHQAGAQLIDTALGLMPVDKMGMNGVSPDARYQQQQVRGMAMQEFFDRTGAVTDPNSAEYRTIAQDVVARYKKIFPVDDKGLIKNLDVTRQLPPTVVSNWQANRPK